MQSCCAAAARRGGSLPARAPAVRHSLPVALLGLCAPAGADAALRGAQEAPLPDREARLEFSRPFWEALPKTERHALLELPLDGLATRAAASDVGARPPARAQRHDTRPRRALRRVLPFLGAQRAKGAYRPC